MACKWTSILRIQPGWLRMDMQMSRCKVTLQDFTIAFQHFAARAGLQPRGFRARRNAQVRDQSSGMRRPCVFLTLLTLYLLVAAQR